MSDELEVIVRADTLTDYVETLRAIVDEATFHFREGEIYTRPRDPANVAMINQSLDDSACEHYHASGFALGLNLERLDDYLGKADSDDLVQLSFDGETRRLEIDYEGTHFSMAGIDPDSVRNGVDVEDKDIWGEDSITSDVEMDGAAFAHAIDVTGMVSDHIEFDSDPNRDSPVHVVGKGDTDDAVVEFSNSLYEGSEVRASASSLFNENYLSDLSRVMPDEEGVRLRHGEEWPMRLDYTHHDGAITVTMMMAPRVTKK